MLDWRAASRRQPLAPEGIGRGSSRVHIPQTAAPKLQFAVLAAAAVRGCAEPDLLDEVAWWQTGYFWQNASLAAIAYIHAAADRAGVPVRKACQQPAHRPGYPAP